MNKKLIHILNALLTTSFGVGAYFLPKLSFAPFGFTLDSTSEMLARGYASTSVGYGLAFWFSRNISDPKMGRNFMIASVAFNAMEAFVQGPLAFSGTVAAAIWVTFGCHVILGLLSAAMIFKKDELIRH